MSIRGLFIVVFGALFLLLAAMLTSTFLLSHDQEQAFQSATRRYDSYRLAEELRQSSDDLTRMARLYVVTGDARYEQYFRDILAIRNGEKPHPQGFGSIYWDLILAHPNWTRPQGPAMSLEARMRQLNFSNAELSKLNQAHERSDELVALENEAMSAMKGLYPDSNGEYRVKGEPNPAKARELLHGPRYHAAKAKIMLPIDEFFTLLADRTARDASDLHARTRVVAWVTIGLLLLLSVAAMIGSYLLHRRAVGPLGVMARTATKLAGGGSVDVLPDSNDELGDVGRAIGRLLLQTGDAVKALSQARDFAEEMQNQLYGVQSDFETLSYAVAHDFPSPVRAVQNYATMVLEDGRLGEQDVEYMRRIVATSVRLSNMLDGMLRLAKISNAPVRVQRVDLTLLSGEVVDDLRRDDPSRGVTVEIAPSMTAFGDPALLRILFANVIGNAWKFTKRSPEARIRIGVQPAEEEGKTIFTVTDNGVGFDPQFSAKLFRLFSRLHAEGEYEGAGIGLATAKRIVERHGGAISATSVPGRETTFSFTLTTRLRTSMMQ